MASPRVTIVGHSFAVGVAYSCPVLDSARTVAELQELHALTGNAEGAQRVCWTETWLLARSWFRQKLEALPVQVETDEAGNLWANAAGDSERAVLIGGHLDSVSNGGWLDGCLNVLAGLEVLRRIAGRAGRRRLCDSSTGPTRRAFASAAVCSVRARPRAAWSPVSSATSETPRARRYRTCSAGTASTSIGCWRRVGNWRTQRRISSSISSKAPCWTSRRSAGSCPRHLWRRAPHRQVSRPACPRRRDADGHAPRSCRGGSPLSPGRAPHRERGGECHHGRHDLGSRWDRDRGRPCLRAVIRPAQPRRHNAAGDGGGRERCERANCSRGGGGGRMGRAVADPGSAVSP